LVGGGTGLVGDPSGKTEMRQLLTLEVVEQNAAGIKKQLARFLDFDGGQALLLNNADWLVDLKYIPFLRDIGRHFSVNRMIKAESYRMRIDSEEGLNFIEFNYMLLQAYDFLMLFRQQGCKLQMGGSDQWGNIVAGVDLVRREMQQTAYGITFPLIMTSSGVKMGKTHKGAVWLDDERTSAYDYFQFWVNTDDGDVARFLALFTFLPMSEIEEVKRLEGADLNVAKTILAFETTRLAHGRKAAVEAHQSAQSMFGSRAVPADILPSSTIDRSDPHGDAAGVPHSVMPLSELEAGIPAFKLFQMIGLAASGGEARRLIAQGGAYVNGERIVEFDMPIAADRLEDGQMVLRSGKKRYHKIIAED